MTTKEAATITLYCDPSTAAVMVLPGDRITPGAAYEFALSHPEIRTSDGQVELQCLGTCAALYGAEVVLAWRLSTGPSWEATNYPIP
jgi:hypothetical protein